MRGTYSASFHLETPTLPLLTNDNNAKHLPKTITKYVSEVNKELINLEKEQYGYSLRSTPVKSKLQRIPTFKRKQTRKSTSILPVVMRLSSNCIKAFNQSAMNDSKTTFKSTPCLRNLQVQTPKQTLIQSVALKKGKLLEELKTINEESSFMNHNLLTDILTYDDKDKRMNKQFEKIKTNKQRLLLNSDEYLRPDIKNPFHQSNKHANDFYSYLDQVIEKVNGSTSIDLFKKMKMLNNEKEKYDTYYVLKSQKKHERVKKLLEESNQIKKRLTKNL